MIIRNWPSTFQQKYERHSRWHLWFAWLPVRVPAGVAWLQHVQRRATPVSLEDHGGMVYEYREIP